MRFFRLFRLVVKERRFVRVNASDNTAVETACAGGPTEASVLLQVAINCTSMIAY